MIGRVLGSYRIVEQIGIGGMATVYKAYDAATDRYVAVKILPEHYSKDPTFRQRFEREAKAIAHMEHIHILPIFTYGDEDGTAYLVMRYMQAGTLADLIGQGPLPVGETSRLLTQVASALDYAHKNGILHRDVKPSNVLVDAEGNAFLTDFGIAKMVEGSSELTGSGLIGTPHYMSPEQCQGVKKLTAASDQYSLGVVLYEMLTGSKPYQAETPVAVILMQVNGPLPSPRSQRPDITDDMEAVIYKALAKQPEMRYASCCAMAEAFARAAQTAQSQAATVPAQTRPGSAPTTSAIPGLEPDQGTVRVAPPTPAPPPTRRRIPAWAIGLIGVLVVGGAILAAVFSGALSGLSGGGNLAITPPAAESPAPSSPILAIKGVRHVFVCLGPEPRQELCVERAGSGDKPLRIKTDLGLESAAWSPDGMQLVINARDASAPRTGPAHTYIMNIADGSLRIVEDKHFDLWAVWSPNGNWLAMHSDGALAVIRPDGTDYRQVWWEPDECIITPQWSPDSKRIVFSAVRCGADPPRRRVFVATLDGIVTPVVEIPPSCDDARVAFSPDGRLIAYMAAPCEAKLINSDGSPTTQTIGNFNMVWGGESFPQWGPIE